MTPVELLAVAAAGGAGAGMRFAAGLLDRAHPERATLAVNVVASLIAGFCTTLMPLDETWRAVLVTGFCGGFSTYSAFAVQVVEQAERRRAGRVAATVSLTLIGGGAAAGLGMLLAGLLAPAIAI